MITCKVVGLVGWNPSHSLDCCTKVCTFGCMRSFRGRHVGKTGQKPPFTGIMRSQHRQRFKTRKQMVLPDRIEDMASASVEENVGSKRGSYDAVGTESATAGDTSLIPTHWLDHVSHLKPGEKRSLKEYFPLLEKVRAWEQHMQEREDDELKSIAGQLSQQVRGPEKRHVMDVLPEAFALVREASSRVLGMKHYDVQILGGIALANGRVAEMRTGEGKTLVAILPAFLYALEGKGSHVVTVNDYLAQRDAEWVGKVLEFLGLDVGVVTSQTPQAQRAKELSADVTYLTAYELAFMYLQDNSAPPSFPVALKRPLHFAVVDEVDSILIDEARNPFIVNMPGTDAMCEQEWMIAVKVAMQLQGPPVPEDMHPEDLMDYFEGIPMEDFMAVDFIPDLRVKGTTITRQGMRKCVRMLASDSIQRVFIAAQNDVSGYDETLHSSFVVLLEYEMTGDDAGKEGRGLSSARLVVHQLQQEKDEVASWNTSASEVDFAINIQNTSEEEISNALWKHGLQILPSRNIPEEIWDRAIPPVLWSGGSKAWGRYISQASRAVHAFNKDVDYIVRDGEIVVIDTATGRERERSRWQAGLHQALEAKELVLNTDPNIEIRPEDFDQGRVTYQVLFSEYSILSGMTGTAATEAEEFEEAYGLSVVRIPPHRPSRRIDHNNLVFGGKSGWKTKLQESVREAVALKRPVLVGTMSVEASEEVQQIIMETPIDPEFTTEDLLVISSAMTRMPSILPKPPTPQELTGSEISVEDLPEEMKAALAFYSSTREKYRYVYPFLLELVNSGDLHSSQYGFMSSVILILKDTLTTRSWSLRTISESDAISDVLKTLVAVVRRSKLGNKISVNLLNARPDRARKEAEIIAQAGLPATVTVATSMAGRGTDILLGGNPKGLTLMALKHLFLEVLSGEVDTDVQRPLAGIHPAWSGISILESMSRYLPKPVCDSFQDCLDRLLDLELTQEQSNASILEQVVEKVELLRAHFKLHVRHSNQMADEWYDKEVLSSNGYVSSLLQSFDASIPTHVYSSLAKYALLQWLWFDTECEKMSSQVRNSGGLAVIIASIPETRRTELQLRGRSGRQGDPGTTAVIASLEDPLLTASLLPKQQRDIWQYIKDSGSSDEPLPSIVIDPVIRTLTRNQEQLQQGAREVARKYDAVIDPYRRHVYRLRRVLTRGNEVSRARLFHRDLRNLADDLVLYHCDPEAPVGEWDFVALLDDALNMLISPQLKSYLANEILEGSQMVIPDSASLSMHYVSDFMVAILEVTDSYHGTQMDACLADVLHDCLRYRKKSLPSSNISSTMVPVSPLRRKAMQLAREEHEGTVDKRFAHSFLRLWMGDFLTSLYEIKRYLSQDALTCSKLSASPLNQYQSSSIIRVWERDIALSCIDALWSDFLQDITVLQAASQSRAFSMFDPVDEFRLETATAFSRLLSQYSRIISSRLLGPVDLVHIRWLERANTSQIDREYITNMLNG